MRLPVRGVESPLTEPMQTPDGIPDVTKAIQLALAPVFLLTAIAGLLNVMTGRLARIVDRGRGLTEGRNGSASAPEESVAREVRNLEQRRRFTSVAAPQTVAGQADLSQLPTASRSFSRSTAV